MPTLGTSVQLGNAFADFYLLSSRDWTSTDTGPYGNNTDVPVPGYYEGKIDIDARLHPKAATLKAVWRPSNGTWYLTDSTGTVRTFQWGIQGDVPLPADYDGDGIDDLMVWRPSTGYWYMFPSNWQGSYNYFNNGYYAWQWGQQGDVPVPADYDGDGKADLAYWRPSEGNWHVLDSSGSSTVQWGQVGDVPVPGNYDGLGTDMAVFRPAEGKWYILNHPRTGAWWVGWGQQGDIPVPGDYDGDGITDLAVFRPSNGTWYWINSSTGYGYYMAYGQTGDVPIP